MLLINEFQRVVSQVPSPGELQAAYKGSGVLAGLRADDTCIRLSVLWVF